MEAYKPWDFCKSIDCLAMRRSEAVNQGEEARKQACNDCKAYQMHQYLKEHGQILEEGSALEAQLAEAQTELNRLVRARESLVELLNQDLIKDGLKYRRALELACEQISEYALLSGTDDMRRKLIAGRQDIFLSQAKRWIDEKQAKGAE
jgi:hypothetical protein